VHTSGDASENEASSEDMQCCTPTNHAEMMAAELQVGTGYRATHKEMIHRLARRRNAVADASGTRTRRNNVWQLRRPRLLPRVGRFRVGKFLNVLWSFKQAQQRKSAPVVVYRQHISVRRRMCVNVDGWVI
jgi:hypothetical protein